MGMDGGSAGTWNRWIERNVLLKNSQAHLIFERLASLPCPPFLIWNPDENIRFLPFYPPPPGDCGLTPLLLPWSCCPCSNQRHIPAWPRARVPEHSPGSRLPVPPLQVNPEPYLDVCIYDSCSCESIGDCACFCDTIAAYAHECAQHGEVVTWRTATLCRESCGPS